MTDRQAKIVAIEAAFRMVLKEKAFPVPHGTPDLEAAFAQIHANLNQVYEHNAARLFNEILVRAVRRERIKMRCLKIALGAAFAAAALLFLLALL